MNYLKKIILFFLIGISVNCKEIARINNNNNIRDDKNRLNMEIEKDEKIKIMTNQSTRKQFHSSLTFLRCWTHYARRYDPN